MSKVKSNNTTNKQFSYSKGTVSLKFGLCLDNKSEVLDFLDCLKAAVLDVESEKNGNS